MDIGIITILTIASTVLISIACFNNREYFIRLSFSPYDIKRSRQYARFITHSFVHADWVHLLVNMFVLFSFGGMVEGLFMQLQYEGIVFSGRLLYVILYFGGAVIASVSSYIKNRDNIYYLSVGASGAVSAVIFTSIFFFPRSPIYFYGIIKIPGIVFGVLYLVYSSYMSKRTRDNINHDAHFWGAVFGFALPLAIDPSLFNLFLKQLFG